MAHGGAFPVGEPCRPVEHGPFEKGTLRARAQMRSALKTMGALPTGDGIGADEVISFLHPRDARPDLLDDPGALMAGNHRDHGRSGTRHKGKVRMAETTVGVTDQDLSRLRPFQSRVPLSCKVCLFPLVQRPLLSCRPPLGIRLSQACPQMISSSINWTNSSSGMPSSFV